MDHLGSSAATNTRLRTIDRRAVFLTAILMLALASAFFAAWTLWPPPQPKVQVAVANSNAMCDVGMSHAKMMADTAAPPSPAGESPVIESLPAPLNAPEGMVWIPGGDFSMGSPDPMFTDARPVHRVALKGIWMDKTEVTNAQFEKFIKATGYTTIAERKPAASDFPRVPVERLVAGSIVFSPPKTAVALNDYMQWWAYIEGADWRHPEGPQSDIKGRDNHPVVHIAWDDANAYAKWAGKRLPTEAEFEWAARGGLDRKKFVWGDEMRPGGKLKANTFQGNFPNKNTSEDGFMSTAPVGTFDPNQFGLYDVAGNVWEWCSDWYRADYYEKLAAEGAISRNPLGPKDSADPAEPGIAKRVTKGGSFLCTDQYCSRYMPGGRGKEAPDTGTNHLGFRLVRDAQ